jgi:hypothetical protein
MRLTGIDLLLWAAGFVGHLILLTILLLRRRAKEFPLFTFLIVWDVLRSVCLFSTMFRKPASAYFESYWIFSAIDTFLELCVIYELAAHTFRPWGRWKRPVLWRLVLLLGGTAAVAAGITAFSTPPHWSWKQTLVIKGSFFSTTWISELFIGMVALSVTTGLPWKTHVARISQGLGGYSLFDMLVEAGHSYFGALRQHHIYRTLSHMRIEAYLCCLLYWIVMLWRDAPPSQEMTPQMRDQLFTLLDKVEYDLQKLRSRESQ